MNYLVAPLLAVFVLSGCDDHHDDEPFQDECGEPDYGGAGTDEAWKTMVDAYDAAEVGSAEAVTVTTPATGDRISAAGAAPTITWTSPIALGPVRPRLVPLETARRAAPSWLDDALAEVGGFFVGRARAHLPPITDDVYYVELRVAGQACAVARVLTTVQSWTLDAAAWTALRAHVGVPIELVITSAYLTENRVTEGPYRPAASTVFELE